jgi:hypothetical protein
MTSPLTATPARADATPVHLRSAATWSLVGGLAHAAFAAAGVATSGPLAPVQNWEYAADTVLAYRGAGLLFSLLILVWALGYGVALIALGRLVWATGTMPGSISRAAGVATGTLIALTGGITLALYSGATADLIESGADVPAQQAAMQAAWIVLHGAWYAAGWIVSAWFVAFAVAAFRGRLFRALGLVLLLLAALSALVTILFTAYPTSLPLVSLSLVVMGVVLRVRAARATRGGRPVDAPA